MIEIDKKLELLASSIVPENFQEETPQFYGLIKSFLRNIEDVQQSINCNFLDCIDVTKIKNEDIVSIYLDTYLAQLNFDSTVSPKTLTDLLLVSKDLSTKKGTIALYKLMINLTVYLVDTVKTQYQTLLDSLENETDLEVIANIEEQIKLFKISNYKEGFFEYYQYDENDEEYLFDLDSVNNENITPFKYKIKADIEKEIFEKYVKPFCHPLGWYVEYIQVLVTFAEEELNTYCRFNLKIVKNLPIPSAGDGYQAGNINQQYTESYDKVIIGTEDEYDFLSSIVVDKSKVYIEDGNVIYDNDGISTIPPYIIIDGDNYITKVDENINKPIYNGTKLPILENGTTNGSDYIKINQYNQVFDLVANSNPESIVGTRYTSAGGGQVAGRKNAFYSKEIVIDK